MSTLAQRQAEFMRAILDEGAPLPGGWGNSQAAGMAVYRGNYRSAVMDALADTFPRTARYVGEAAFRKASMHHVIAHPPAHWTIDAVGAGFDATCARLFEKNPEVAELAWLEWTMLELASAPDPVPVTPQDFAAASAGFAAEDWANLTLKFQLKSAARTVAYDLTALWQSLDEASTGPSNLSKPGKRGCLVWREGEQPVFVMVEPDAACAFSAMQNGASYGEIVDLIAGDDPGEEAIQNAAIKVGAMLGEWLTEGLVCAFET